MHADPSAPPAGPGVDMQVFFDALSAGEIERAGDCLAHNALLLLPGVQPVHGRRRAIRLLRLLRRRFGELRWLRASALDAEPGWSIATWTVVGTLADGTRFRQEVASVARLDVEGRIAYLSDYLKPTDRPGHRAVPQRLASPRP